MTTIARFKKHLIVILLISVWIGTSSVRACDCPEEYDVLPSIRIGLLPYLHGSDESIIRNVGKPMLRAARLAVEAVNNAGGLDLGECNAKVVLIVAAIAPDTEEAVNAARKLIELGKVAAIVGPQFNDHAISVAQIAEKAHIPMITPNSTHPETTLNKQYVFRVGWTDTVQGQMMADFARNEFGVQQAAILYDATYPYSNGLAEAFTQAFEEAGGQIAALETFTQDERDFQPQLKHIQENGAEILFLPNAPEQAVLQAQQAHQMGMRVPLLGCDCWRSLETLDTLGLEEAFYTSQCHPELEEARAFADLYRETYHYTQSLNATPMLTYDAFQLLFNAIQHQGNAEPDSIRDGLYSMGPYAGVTGTIEYRDSGDPVNRNAVIIQIKEGKHVFYKQIPPVTTLSAK